MKTDGNVHFMNIILLSPFTFAIPSTFYILYHWNDNNIIRLKLV